MPPAMPPTRNPAPRGPPPPPPPPPPRGGGGGCPGPHAGPHAGGVCGPSPPPPAPPPVGLLGVSPCLLACLLACLLCCHSPPPAAAVDWSQYPDTLVPPDYDPDAPPPEDHSRAAQERRLEQQRVAAAARAAADSDAGAQISAAAARLPDIETSTDADLLELVAAAETGQEETVSEILARGRVDVDGHEPKMGDTPLHAAVWGGHLDIVLLLLRTASADPNTKNMAGYTPLLLACRSQRAGSLEIMKKLLLAGANPWETNNNGNNPLHWAAHLGRVEATEWLLGENGAVVDLPNEDGKTALMLAADAGKDLTATVLLDNGASMDMVEPAMGRNSLHLAANKGNARVVKLLLERGADKETTDQFNETPLDLAKAGQHSQAEYLLSGRDPHTGEPLPNEADL